MYLFYFMFILFLSYENSFKTIYNFIIRNILYAKQETLVIPNF